MIPRNQFMDLSDKTKVAQTLADSVQLLLNNKFYTPAFCLMAVGIDALSDGNRSTYIAYLEKYFPQLCSGLGAELFYTKYRNGMIHEYQPRKGFALTEDRELGDKAVESLLLEGDSSTLTAVNVEHLGRQFIKFAHSFNT